MTTFFSFHSQTPLIEENMFSILAPECLYRRNVTSPSPKQASKTGKSACEAKKRRIKRRFFPLWEKTFFSVRFLDQSQSVRRRFGLPRSRKCLKLMTKQQLPVVAGISAGERENFFQHCEQHVIWRNNIENEKKNYVSGLWAICSTGSVSTHIRLCINYTVRRLAACAALIRPLT